MNKTNILLVDDDEIYLYLMKRTIGELSNNLVVSSFTDGEEAIEYVAECTKQKSDLPRVILLDVNMPFLDGWGFLAEFKKLKPKIDNPINIYMVSSSSMEKDIKRASEFEEITGYIVKPISETKLVEIFKESIADPL